jgi:hypothetical protein
VRRVDVPESVKQVRTLNRQTPQRKPIDAFAATHCKRGNADRFGSFIRELLDTSMVWRDSGNLGSGRVLILLKGANSSPSWVADGV